MVSKKDILEDFKIVQMVKLYLFSNGSSFECYSRFDQSRSHQTLVQMLASYFVVVITIVNSTLAQYSEGVKKKNWGWVPPHFY